MIEYKAVWSNIPVVYIQPQYTSQVCPKCLSTNKRVKHNYKCKYCGYEANADYIASVNINKKFLEGISFKDSAPINRAVGFSFCEPKAVIELKAKKSVKLEGVSPPMTEVKGIRNTDIL